MHQPQLMNVYQEFSDRFYVIEHIWFRVLYVLSSFMLTADEWLSEEEIENTNAVIDIINERRKMNISWKESAEKADVDYGKLLKIGICAIFKDN